MYIKIHRGSLQIGGNIIEVGSNGVKVILDCGRNLPALDTNEAVDDIDIAGLTSGEAAYDGVFISHYHGDHCGNINRVMEHIPVYMGVKTEKVLNIIADFTNSDLKYKINTFNEYETIGIGGMQITPIQVPHSAADAYMFLVRADGKIILYTGDYKQVDEIIPKVQKLLADNERIDVLLTEGTNATPGRSTNNLINENGLAGKCAEIMENTDGVVFVLGSSTNIDRINAVMQACEQSGRTFAEDLFTACIMDAVGCDSAFSNKKIKGFVWHGFNKDKPRRFRYFKEHYDRRELHGIESTASIKNLCAYIKPTMLSFLEDMDKIKSLADSTLIYSFWSGYRKKADVAELLDFYERTGLKVVPLHVSGHAAKQEIEFLINELNPVTVIPIHCEDRETFTNMSANCTFLNDNEIMIIK